MVAPRLAVAIGIVIEIHGFHRKSKQFNFDFVPRSSISSVACVLHLAVFDPVTVVAEHYEGALKACQRSCIPFRKEEESREEEKETKRKIWCGERVGDNPACTACSCCACSWWLRDRRKCVETAHW